MTRNVIILLFFMGSCATEKPEQRAYTHVFHLADRYNYFGKMHCTLPADFDTSYSYIKISDCLSCDHRHYWSHPSGYEPIKTTPSWFADLPDSGFYFKISFGMAATTERSHHDPRGLCRQILVSEMNKNPAQAKYLEMDTNTVVDGQKVCILKQPRIFCKDLFEYFDVYTSIDSVEINISFMNNVLPSDSFRKVAYDITRSIWFEDYSGSVK